MMIIARPPSSQKNARLCQALVDRRVWKNVLKPEKLFKLCQSARANTRGLSTSSPSAIAFNSTIMPNKIGMIPAVSERSEFISGFSRAARTGSEFFEIIR